LIQVVDVPRFDPATLSYAIGAEEGERSPDRVMIWVAGFSAGLLALAVCALVWARRIRARRTRGWRARRLASRLRRELEKVSDAVDAGRRVTEGVASYLGLAVHRPPGALTPREAEQGMGEATGSSELARRCGLLIVACDRAQF